MRRLGDNQKSFLRSMYERGGWYDGCGWYWESASRSTRIAESLVGQGLATKRRPLEHSARFSWSVDKYELTAEGEQYALRFGAKRKGGLSNG